MTIETKYSLGDTLWCMGYQKIESFEVTQINPAPMRKSGAMSNHYYHGQRLDHALPEHMVFPTKEALLATL